MDVKLQASTSPQRTNCTHTHTQMFGPVGLKKRQWLFTVAALFMMANILSWRNDVSLVDLSFSALRTNNNDITKDEEFTITDATDPDLLERQSLEIRVNELMKKKLAVELKYEREQLAKLADDLQLQKAELRKERGVFAKEKEELFRVRNCTKSDYTRLTYTKSLETIDNSAVFSTIISRDVKQLEDWFALYGHLEWLDRSKVTLSLVVVGESLFDEINTHINDLFESKEVWPNFFSRVNVIRAPVLETINSKQRRLAQLKNYIIQEGISNEMSLLYIDANVIEIPSDLFKVFMETGVDIATIPVKSLSGEYELDSWTGELAGPSLEQAEQMDDDPEHVLVPRDNEHLVRLSEVAQTPVMFNVTDLITAKFKLTALGGSIQFFNTVLFRRGVTFPVLNSIGTDWNRLEGWNGLGDEGICYHAAALNYTCWGFPNMVASRL